jgi:23S rRNA (cytidine1920-2'-O)/16S rRNA (cytidine1409-2'-O)-methyltransferase
VRDPAVHLQAVDKIRSAGKTLGLAERGLIESPAKGPKGNVEFLLWLSPDGNSGFAKLDL